MISIIMSTYKEEEYLLRQSIESILNQSYCNFEFIIILDNPQNTSHKIIIETYQRQDDRIKFLINDANKGLTYSLNRGIRLAQGEYVARMDADDVSYPNRLEKQLAYLKDNDYDLVGGITQIIDEQGHVSFSIKSVPTDFDKIKKALKYGQCIAHPTWMGKKEVFLNLNGYRNIPLCEDYDFTLRAVLKGYKISNLNDTVLQYRMSKNSISRTNLYEQYLYMKYITRLYANHEIANIDNAKKYVNKNLDDKKIKKYLKANELFNSLLKNIEQKEFLKFIKNGFKLLFCSKEYLNKIYRFVMLSLNS